MSGKAEQKARLEALAGRHFGEGARVVAIDTALGGGSNQTTFFEVLETGAATPLRLVLRHWLRKMAAATTGWIHSQRFFRLIIKSMMDGL